VAEQRLNGAEVGAVFEQVGGEGRDRAQYRLTASGDDELEARKAGSWPAMVVNNRDVAALKRQPRPRLRAAEPAR